MAKEKRQKAFAGTIVTGQNVDKAVTDMNRYQQAGSLIGGGVTGGGIGTAIGQTYGSLGGIGNGKFSEFIGATAPGVGIATTAIGIGAGIVNADKQNKALKREKERLKEAIRKDNIKTSLRTTAAEHFENVVINPDRGTTTFDSTLKLKRGGKVGKMKLGEKYYEKRANGGEVGGDQSKDPSGTKDDKKGRLLPGSVVLPKIHADTAQHWRNLYFPHTTGNDVSLKGNSGVPVALSTGEHVFSPDEAQFLENEVGINFEDYFLDNESTDDPQSFLKCGGRVKMADGGRIYAATGLKVEDLTEVDNDPKGETPRIDYLYEELEQSIIEKVQADYGKDAKIEVKFLGAERDDKAQQGYKKDGASTTDASLHQIGAARDVHIIVNGKDIKTFDAYKKYLWAAAEENGLFHLDEDGFGKSDPWHIGIVKETGDGSAFGRAVDIFPEIKQSKAAQATYAELSTRDNLSEKQQMMIDSISPKIESNQNQKLAGKTEKPKRDFNQAIETNIDNQENVTKESVKNNSNQKEKKDLRYSGKIGAFDIKNGLVDYFGKTYDVDKFDIVGDELWYNSGKDERFDPTKEQIEGPGLLNVDPNIISLKEFGNLLMDYKNNPEEYENKSVGSVEFKDGKVKYGDKWYDIDKLNVDERNPSFVYQEVEGKIKKAGKFKLGLNDGPGILNTETGKSVNDLRDAIVSYKQEIANYNDYQKRKAEENKDFVNETDPKKRAAEIAEYDAYQKRKAEEKHQIDNVKTEEESKDGIARSYEQIKFDQLKEKNAEGIAGLADASARMSRDLTIDRIAKNTAADKKLGDYTDFSLAGMNLVGDPNASPLAYDPNAGTKPVDKTTNNNFSVHTALSGLLAAGQIGVGLAGAFGEGDRPNPTVDPILQGRYNDAIFDENYGLTPQERHLAENQIEAARVDSISMAKNYTDNPNMALAFANKANLDASEAKLKVDILDSQIKREKKQRTDAVAAMLNREKVRVQEEKLKSYDFDQQSYATAIASGIDNLLGMTRFNEYKDRLNNSSTTVNINAK